MENYLDMDDNERQAKRHMRAGATRKRDASLLDSDSSSDRKQKLARTAATGQHKSPPHAAVAGNQEDFNVDDIWNQFSQYQDGSDAEDQYSDDEVNKHNYLDKNVTHPPKDVDAALAGFDIDKELAEMSDDDSESDDQRDMISQSLKISLAPIQQSKKTMSSLELKKRKSVKVTKSSAKKQLSPGSEEKEPLESEGTSSPRRKKDTSQLKESKKRSPNKSATGARVEKVGKPKESKTKKDVRARKLQDALERGQGLHGQAKAASTRLSEVDEARKAYNKAGEEMHSEEEDNSPEVPPEVGPEVEQPAPPPVISKPKISKGARVTEGRREAPIDYEVYEPASNIPLEESDPDFDKYSSRMVFATDPCPELGAGRSDDPIKWKQEVAGTHRVNVDGDFSKKKIRNTGCHMDAEAIQERHRKSAMEKLRLWREKAPILRTLKRKARHVTLEMGLPISYEYEASSWATQLTFLSKSSGIIKHLMKDSFVVIKLELPSCSVASRGHVKALIEELRKLMIQCPKYVSIVISNESSWMDVQTAALHNVCDIDKELQRILRTQTRKEAAGEEILRHREDRLLRLFVTSMDELETKAREDASARRSDNDADPCSPAQIQADTYAQYQVIEDSWRDEKMKTIEQSNGRIDEYAELCKDFMHEVQRFRDDGILPGQDEKPDPDAANVESEKISGTEIGKSNNLISDVSDSKPVPLTQDPAMTQISRASSPVQQSPSSSVQPQATNKDLRAPSTSCSPPPSMHQKIADVEPKHLDKWQNHGANDRQTQTQDQASNLQESTSSTAAPSSTFGSQVQIPDACYAYAMSYGQPQGLAGERSTKAQLRDTTARQGFGDPKTGATLPRAQPAVGTAHQVSGSRYADHWNMDPLQCQYSVQEAHYNGSFLQQATMHDGRRANLAGAPPQQYAPSSGAVAGHRLANLAGLPASPRVFPQGYPYQPRAVEAAQPYVSPYAPVNGFAPAYAPPMAQHHHRYNTQRSTASPTAAHGMQQRRTPPTPTRSSSALMKRSSE